MGSREANPEWISYMADLKEAVEDEFAESISFGALHRMVMCSTDAMTKYKNGQRPFHISLLKIICLETSMDMKPWVDRGVDIGYWKRQPYYEQDWRKRSWQT